MSDMTHDDAPPPAPVLPKPASRPASVLAAIAASLFAAVATWQAVSARSEVGRLTQELVHLRVMAGQEQSARKSLQQQVDAFTKVSGVLSASDVVLYALAGSGGAANAHARAYVTQKNGMIFTAEGVPELPSGKVYQLWIIVAAKPVSMGTFAPDANGRVNAVMSPPDIAALPGAVAVTVEPTGGLPQPSTAPVLLGTAAPR